MMKKTRFIPRCGPIESVLLALCALFGCGENAPPECVPPNKKVVIEKTEFTPMEPSYADRIKMNQDHCQACVLSRERFFSCQRAWGKPDESRDALRERALDLACKDAGYHGECPTSAVAQVLCKGDRIPRADVSAPKVIPNAQLDKLSEKETPPSTSTH